MSTLPLSKRFLLLTIGCVLPMFLASQELPPDHPISLYRKGLEYQRAGDFYKALELFKTASAKNPAYFDPVFASAELFFRLEEHDEALRMVDAALRLSRSDSAARVLKARILVGMGRYQEAGELYGALLKSEPNNLDARLGKAELDVALGRNRNAALEYLDALKRFPDNRRALLSMGVLLSQQGNPQEAELYFDSALRYHHDSPLVHLLAGEFYFRQKKIDLAAERAFIALTIKPDYAEAHHLLGLIHFQRGEYAEAANRMDRILSINRNHPLAFYLKALATLRMTRTNEGIALLRSLLTMVPEDEIARITLEDVLRESLPVEDPLRKNVAQYHFDRGDKFQERNLFQRAMEEYRRGLQIDPYSKRGRLSYAEMQQKVGFSSYAYNSLDFLRKQNLADKTVLELLEIAEASQADRVSRRWKYDAHNERRASFNLSLFVNLKGSALLHGFAEPFLARYLGDLLTVSPALQVPTQPFPVETIGEAFQEARQRGTDYFIILAFGETEREFSVTAEIYLSRTGGKIDSFAVYRTGNDRVQNALLQAAALIREKFPKKGTLLKRDFDKGLVSLGAVDGVKKGDKFHILPDRGVSLKNDSFGFTFSNQEVLGTFTVIEVDDLVCEGTVTKNGFFDRVNPGDALVPLQEQKPEAQKPETPSASPPPSASFLYRSILRIQ